MRQRIRLTGFAQFEKEPIGLAPYVRCKNHLGSIVRGITQQVAVSYNFKTRCGNGLERLAFLHTMKRCVVSLCVAVVPLWA